MNLLILSQGQSKQLSILKQYYLNIIQEAKIYVYIYQLSQNKPPIIIFRDQAVIGLFRHLDDFTQNMKAKLHFLCFLSRAEIQRHCNLSPFTATFCQKFDTGLRRQYLMRIGALHILNIIRSSNESDNDAITRYPCIREVSQPHITFHAESDVLRIHSVYSY